MNDKDIEKTDEKEPTNNVSPDTQGEGNDAGDAGEKKSRKRQKQVLPANNEEVLLLHTQIEELKNTIAELQAIIAKKEEEDYRNRIEQKVLEAAKNVGFLNPHDALHFVNFSDITPDTNFFDVLQKVAKERPYLLKPSLMPKTEQGKTPTNKADSFWRGGGVILEKI
jgi:hypothetical protein